MSVKTEPLLAVHGLHVETEAGRILVDSASFEIHAGETLAIVGESGSGKTLSALSLLGLLPKGVRAASGKAVFFGQNILNLSENQLQKVRGKQIGMIFQEPMSALNPVVTIGVQMTEALRVHTELDRRAARNVALRALDLVQLARAKELLGRYPHELSGGMRQRVMIAAAMALEPSLLIADEPTTALDVRVQAQILALLQDLKSRFEMALLLITHDMGVVAEVADQVLVMRHGQVEETGPVLEIFGAPQAAYTRALLAAVPSGTGKFADKVEPMGPPVLKIENLRKSFGTGGLFGSGTRLILSDVTLSIAIGETLALVGESGSGKSTLGRAVVRLLDVDSGSILVDGEDIAAARSGRLRLLRRKVQILFQDPYASLDPRMSVIEAIAEPLVIHGIMTARMARGRALDMLQEVGLAAELAHRYPHQLSGGQRQRVALARALVVEPRLLIADEPTSALDVSVQAQILQLMTALQRRLGLAYLFITHDLAAVRGIAHRVAVMREGRIVEIGPTCDVLDAPRHPYTRALIDAVPIADPARARHRRGGCEIAETSIDTLESRVS
jgi:ABC-type glutathione transport system ATPase component